MDLRRASRPANCPRTSRTLRSLRAMRAIVALLLALMAATFSADATAHPAGVRLTPTTFSWSGGRLFGNLSVQSALAKLKSLTTGAPVVIATRVYLFQTGSGAPDALAVQRCKVTYSAWDEFFRIELTRGGPTGVSRTLAVSEAGVARVCGGVESLALAQRAALAPGQHYFAAVVVDVAPVPAFDVALQAWVTGPVTPGTPLFALYDALLVTPPPASVTARFVTTDFVP